MTYLAIISFVILFTYCFLIGYYLFTFYTLSPFEDIKEELNVKVSVIIIGRNEGKNIEKCLASIQKNSYSQSNYEIIYVDDHSEDKSIEKLKKLKIKNIKILKLQDYIGSKVINSYKKEGIAYAIKHAGGELILHTDADTVVAKDWIRSHASAFSAKKANFISAPVFLIANNNFLEQFQYLDFITTMGITAAGNHSSLHFMANGANMSYPSNCLNLTNLESGSSHASGDDMFLVHEIGRKDPESVFFLINEGSEVITHPEKNWKDFFRQRIRWATKTKAYKDHNLKMVTALVFVTNAFTLLLFTFAISSGSYTGFLAYFILKSFVDFIFINRSAKLFKKQVSLFWVILSLAFYPFYYLITALYALGSRKYLWKDRVVR